MGARLFTGVGGFKDLAPAFNTARAGHQHNFITSYYVIANREGCASWFEILTGQLKRLQYRHAAFDAR
jgi:hypothetical protein